MKRCILYKGRILYLILSMVLFTFSAKAKVVTYNPPPEVKQGNEFVSESPEYKIELIQNGRTFSSFVYQMPSKHYTNNSRANAWTNFSFEQVVTVRVTKLKGAVDFVQVLPRTHNVQPTVAGNIVEFNIHKPGQYSVEFEKGIKIAYPLFIFADPLEKAIPSRNDPNVIYYGPGYYNIGIGNKIPSGKTVYIAGGAYIRGQFVADSAESIKIIGRGILSGEDHAARTANHMITMSASNNIRVEGITIIHSPRFMITLSGSNHHIKNVKMMGWWFSTDGVSTGENALIEDCFFKVNDDAIKMYQNNTIARNCVIWQMENGMPFQLGWGRSGIISNGFAYNCDVIRVEHEWDNENEAVFGAIHGGSGHIKHYLFEDIRIDNSDWRIFHLVSKPNRWGSWDPENGKLSDIHFRNIIYYGKQRIPSLVMGHDAKHPVYNITFENVVINGEKIETPTRDNFIIDRETTFNIQFR